MNAKTTPLKWQATIIAGQSPPSDEVSEFDGRGRPFLQGNAEFGSESPVPRLRCDKTSRVAQAGDLLLSIRAPVGAINRADRDYGIGRGLAAIRPGPLLDVRFAWWWLHTSVEELRAGAVGSTYDAVTADEVVALPLPILPPGEQRAIANFLDAETARIDALITKKRRLMNLIAEHHRSRAEVLLESEQRVPLRWHAELLPGYMFSSSDFGPEELGPRLLRGTNVSVGAFNWRETVRLRLSRDRPVPHRYILAEDDVVIGMDRPFIGGGTRVARIDADSAGALLLQRVCRVRTPSRNNAILIEHVLSSRRFLAHIEPDLTGVSVPHLSDEQIGSMPVPVLSQRELAAVVLELCELQAWKKELSQKLEEQITLLQERRQALITAAVTGQSDIPEAAA